MHAATLLLFLTLGQFDNPACMEDSPPLGLIRTRAERERQTMPYMPGTGRTAPSRHVQFGPHVSIQVNVDGSGNNILDDAANEPSIAVDPTNPYRMAIGWRQFDSVNSSFRQAAYGYSADGGHHWTFPGVLEPGVFRTDPVLTSGPDNTFYYCSLNFVSGLPCHVFRSHDRGQTWPTSTFSFGGDKPWIVADNSNGMGRGNIYQTWPAGFTRSIDGGLTWMQPILLQVYYGSLAIGVNSELYVAGTGSSSPVSFAKSLNASNGSVAPTFSIRPVNLDGSLSYGVVNPDGLDGQFWVASDVSMGPSRGNIYILGSVARFGTNAIDVMFNRSTDGGTTWQDPLRINSDSPMTGAMHWFGTLSAAPNGRIDVIWNDTRHSPMNQYVCEVFYSSSLDGGISWAPNEQLTPAWGSTIGFPQQAKIGDYYHMVSDDLGANLAYAATFNGEQDVWFLRIGDYPCLGLITSHPASPSVCQGSAVSLRATADPRGDELTYEWRKNSAPLADSADILGTQSPTLVFLHAQPADTGEYDCYVKRADCGADISHKATLTVFPTGSADLNNDKSINALDIASFIAALVNHDPVSPSLCAADLTGEGIVSDVDIPPFVTRLLGE